MKKWKIAVLLVPVIAAPCFSTAAWPQQGAGRGKATAQGPGLSLMYQLREDSRGGVLDRSDFDTAAMIGISFQSSF